MSPAKVIFIMVKVLLLSIMFILGMRSHYTRTNRINSVFKLFVFYIILLLLLCVYEFLYTVIPLLHVTMVLSGMGKLAGVQIFQEKAKHFQDPDKTRVLKKFIWGFYGMYLALLCITPFDIIGAYCSERFTYPPCFMFLLYTELFLFIFTTKLFLNDYYLDELRVSQINLVEEQ